MFPVDDDVIQRAAFEHARPPEPLDSEEHESECGFALCERAFEVRRFHDASVKVGIEIKVD